VRSDARFQVITKRVFAVLQNRVLSVRAPY
jgi:hypothetical protein